MARETASREARLRHEEEDSNDDDAFTAHRPLTGWRLELLPSRAAPRTVQRPGESQDAITHSVGRRLAHLNRVNCGFLRILPLSYGNSGRLAFRPVALESARSCFAIPSLSKS